MAEQSQSRRGMVIGALAALVIAATVAVVRQRDTPELIVQSDEDWAGDMRVAVMGEVITPGTYILRGDARLMDLIAAAGGYTDTAAREVLNPAARVSDGQAYTIPLQPTLAPRAATATARATTTPPREPTISVTTPTLASAADTMSTPTASGATDNTSSVRALESVAAQIVPEIAAREGTPHAIIAPAKATAASRALPYTTTGTAAKVNINTAFQDELASLPYIGPTLAERIIIDRMAHGPYRRIEDLARVRGISARTVEDLRDRITVG